MTRRSGKQRKAAPRAVPEDLPPEVWEVIAGRRSWALVEGDSLALMHALPADVAAHVLTDPPYEAACHQKGRQVMLRGATQALVERPLDFEQITEADRLAAAAHFARLARGWILVFCQVEGVTPWMEALVGAGAKWRRAQVWSKPNGTPQLTGDRPAQAVEMIATAWAGEGGSTWNGGGRRGIYEYPVVKAASLAAAAGVSMPGCGATTPHPTMKPLGLMLELVELFTNPGDLVLDPYAGSASTGVACLRLGRRFLGFERDPKYAALSRERLEAEGVHNTIEAARRGQRSLFEV